jgi:dTDP-glucose 4,6-dehydratase
VGKTILVTGGAGFIGSNFVRYLHDRYPDDRLVVLDALTYAGRLENLPEAGRGTPRCEFWRGTVCDEGLVDSLVSRADVVVHMAAESSVTRSIDDSRLFFQTDVLGTQTVADAVTRFRERVELFVYISSSEVYGTAVAEVMDESHPLEPSNPYAAAKCGADRLVSAYHRTYGIPAVIVRPFNNYGPRQHLEKVVPRFITSCILGEPLTVHGNGDAARDFLFVEDHCVALDRLLRIDPRLVIGQTINLGTGRHLTILELAHKVRQTMGATHLPLKLLGDRPGQIARHTCDASRARCLLGWVPSVSFEEGLLRTAQWYRQNEPWWRSQLPARHIPICTASGQEELH